MGRRSITGGVMPAGHACIQFDFRIEGQRFRPTLPWIPHETNLRRARAYLARIKAQIAAGTFCFADEFPRYKGLSKLPPPLRARTVSQTLRGAPHLRELEPDGGPQSAVGGEGTWPPPHHDVDRVCRLGRRRGRAGHSRDPRGDEPHRPPACTAPGSSNHPHHHGDPYPPGLRTVPGPKSPKAPRHDAGGPTRRAQPHWAVDWSVARHRIISSH
jgi:hypothetical protein